MRIKALLPVLTFYNGALAYCNDNKTFTKHTITKHIITTPTIKPIIAKTNTFNTTKFKTKFRTTNTTKFKKPHKPKGIIPIIRGNSATLTYFTDSVFQCTTQAPEYALAVNPLLLGFTVDDWIKRFSNVDSSRIPWCGKRMRLTVNGSNFTGVIIDTCDPVGNTFPDPVTGEMIGGKCDYDDVIDLYGEVGRSFLQGAVGDDFYKGDLEWELL